MSTLKVNNVEDLGADPVVTNGVIEKAALPSGSILQVVSTAKTDTFTTTSTTFTGVTGLTASITPSSATSKIIIFASVNAGNTNTSGADTATVIRLSGGNSGNLVGDAASARTRVATSTYSSSVYRNDVENVLKTIVYLDSPATTSAVTYGVQIATVPGSTGTVNRSGSDFDAAPYGRSASTITLMEVAG